MNKCIHLKYRTKQGNKYLYCSKHKENTDFQTCRECLDKEYKRNKGINKVSKNKEKTSPETYEYVYNRDKGQCAICLAKHNLQLHHILGRGKDKTDNPNNCIMLCMTCHLEVVHKNQKKWRPVLIQMVERVKKGNK